MHYSLFFIIFLLVATVQQICRPKYTQLDWKECQGTIKVIYKYDESYEARNRFKKLTCDFFMKLKTHGKHRYFVHFHIVNTLCFIRPILAASRKRKGPRRAPTEVDDEERMIINLILVISLNCNSFY